MESLDEFYRNNWMRPTNQLIEIHGPEADNVRAHFWHRLTDPLDFYLVDLLSTDIEKNGASDILNWLKQWPKGPVQDIMSSQVTSQLRQCKQPVVPKPFDKVFLAHLVCALAVANNWPVDEPKLWLQGLKNVNWARHVPLGFLQDLRMKLDNKPIRPAAEHKVIVPFATSTMLVQFRLELIPAGRCETYLSPEQAFFEMDKDFFEAVFVNAPSAARAIAGKSPMPSGIPAAGNKELSTHRGMQQATETAESHIGPDIRVRIELFVPQLSRELAKFLTLPVTGPSAGAAAALGMHALLTGKVPDERVIPMAGVRKDGSLYQINLDGKIKLAAECGKFDTIVVAGDADEAVKELLRDDWRVLDHPSKTQLVWYFEKADRTIRIMALK